MLLDELEATLESAGAGFDNVLKTNVYLLSFEDGRRSTRSTPSRRGDRAAAAHDRPGPALGVGAIEIEMVAHVREP